MARGRVNIGGGYIKGDKINYSKFGLSNPLLLNEIPYPSDASGMHNISIDCLYKDTISNRILISYSASQSTPATKIIDMQGNVIAQFNFSIKKIKEYNGMLFGGSIYLYKIDMVTGNIHKCLEIGVGGDFDIYKGKIYNAVDNKVYVYDIDNFNLIKTINLPYPCTLATQSHSTKDKFCIDKDGNFFCVDSTRKVVYKVSHDGDMLLEIKGDVYGIWIVDKNLLIVSHSYLIYNIDGTLLYTLNNDGASYTNNGFLYTTIGSKIRKQEINTGKIEYEFNTKQDTTFKIGHIAFEGNDLYLAYIALLYEQPQNLFISKYAEELEVIK